VGPLTNLLLCVAAGQFCCWSYLAGLQIGGDILARILSGQTRVVFAEVRGPRTKAFVTTLRLSLSTLEGRRPWHGQKLGIPWRREPGNLPGRRRECIGSGVLMGFAASTPRAFALAR
jgi:hypothetical protein